MGLDRSKQQDHRQMEGLFDQVTLTNAGGVTNTIFATTAGKIFLTLLLADISTAGQVTIAVPFACTVEKITTSLTGVIATASAVLTFKNAAAASMGTITYTVPSSIGLVDSLTPSSNNILAADDFIEMETAGASTNTVPVIATFTLVPTS